MLTINRRSVILLTTSALFVPPLALAAAPMRVTLYKDPQCGCCEGHADYLNKNGFLVDIIPTDDLLAMFRRAGVPPSAQWLSPSRWTVMVIGRVPVDVIRKLLAERPKVIGISIPGMPVGLPGMDGPRSAPIAVYEIAAGAARNRVFAMVS